MYKSMEEIQQANREAGRYWFSPDTMEFFETIIESEVIGGQYFISSEKPPHAPRAFAVRCADEAGHISTVGKTCEFPTLAAAELAVEELVGVDDDYHADAIPTDRRGDDDAEWDCLGQDHMGDDA